MWKFPKYKKGDNVKSPDGKGCVVQLQYMDGKNWYQLDSGEAWYREDELKPA
jgi:hypothetical protein